MTRVWFTSSAVFEFLKTLARRECTVIITSDHGNIEDLTTKSHTRHPVPLYVYGAGAASVARRFTPDADLTAVTPLILEYIGA